MMFSGLVGQWRKDQDQGSHRCGKRSGLVKQCAEWLRRPFQALVLAALPRLTSLLGAIRRELGDSGTRTVAAQILRTMPLSLCEDCFCMPLRGLRASAQGVAVPRCTSCGAPGQWGRATWSDRNITHEPEFARPPSRTCIDTRKSSASQSWVRKASKKRGLPSSEGRREAQNQVALKLWVGQRGQVGSIARLTLYFGVVKAKGVVGNALLVDGPVSSSPFLK